MKKSKNKGITLIALVITIIILLILAGVTIGMATSGTGLFDKAKEASQKYQNAQEKEEIQIANYSNEIDDYINNSRNDIMPELLWTNPNTDLDSTFLGQKIPLDLSNYKYVIVITRTGQGYDNIPRSAGIFEVSQTPLAVEYDYVHVGATDTRGVRGVWATSNGVEITNQTGGYNSNCVPIYIYGIKGDLGLKLRE